MSFTQEVLEKRHSADTNQHSSEIEVTSSEIQSSGGRKSRKAKTTAELKIMGNKAMKTDGKTGRWSAEEHIRFLQGLIKHGKNWKLVQRHVNMTFQPTNSSEKGLQRSGPQIRSHAQKFFKRILPNCLIGETSIQCLIRNNFSIDLIVSGIEDTQEKEDLKEKLEEKLQDFPK